MRVIKYIPKITNARTQYVDIDSDDMAYIQSELVRYLALMGELDGNRNEDIKQIMRFWWYKRNKLLPKSMHGQNSPLTFTAGLVNNLVYGSQVNLSTHVMDGIEYISSQMHQLELALQDITNQNTGQPIKFTLALTQFKLP